ncbi:MAG: hypothetical protein RI894_491 [Bacteroidota bacterium]|jgi:hypothetical protein
MTKNFFKKTLFTTLLCSFVFANLLAQFNREVSNREVSNREVPNREVPNREVSNREFYLMKVSVDVLAPNGAMNSLPKLGNSARIKVGGITPATFGNLLEKGVIDHIEWIDAAKTAFIGEFSKEEVAIINTEAVTIEVLIADLPANLAALNKGITPKMAQCRVTTLPRGFNLGSMGGYLTFAEYLLEMDSLHAMYPTLVSPKFSIGTTIEGRSIWAYKVSDNVGIDENEPEVLIDGLIHAREGVAGMQSMYFITDLLDKYTQNDPEARFLVNNRELFVVPVINPDGYVYNETTDPQGGGLWRKNRRDNLDGTFGVDLNRNWGHFWGFNDSGSSPGTVSETYRGTGAFSEPETASMRDFCNVHSFKTALNHHTYSNLMIRPYGYDEFVSCDDDTTSFAEYGTILTATNGFLYGKSSQTVGYAVNGTTDDWMYGERTSKAKIVSFTPETGSGAEGFWPPITSIIPLCQTVEDANFKILWLGGEYFQGTSMAHTVTTTTGNVPFLLKNIGQSTSLAVTARFVSTSPYITANPVKSLGTVGSFATKKDSVSITFAANTPGNTLITGNIVATFGGYNDQVPVSFYYRPLVNIENASLQQNVAISPNPVNDLLHLESEQPISMVKITDITGKTLRISLENNREIDVHELPTGLYLLSLYNKDQLLIGTAKFVKE